MLRARYRVITPDTLLPYTRNANAPFTEKRITITNRVMVALVLTAATIATLTVDVITETTATVTETITVMGVETATETNIDVAETTEILGESQRNPHSQPISIACSTSHAAEVEAGHHAMNFPPVVTAAMIIVAIHRAAVHAHVAVIHANITNAANARLIEIATSRRSLSMFPAGIPNLKAVKLADTCQD